MIADTSAWIEFLRGTGSRTHRHLRATLHEREPLYALPVIAQEVMQGARSPAHFVQLQRLVSQFPEPPGLPTGRELARDAAALYARCRWQGWTVRSPNDCLIAAAAAACGQPLLAHDRDFATLARVEPRLVLA